VNKRPTYADVARQAGVSATTVSFVLNGRAEEMSIPQQTRDRVLAAARELDYRPNRLTRGGTQGRTYTVGVIVPRLQSSFYARIVHGIQEVCDERSCGILLGYSRHDPLREAAQVDLFLEHRVDAIISLTDEFTAAASGRWIRSVAPNLPVVIVDDSSHSRVVDSVVPNDEEGVRLAVDYLVSLGHSRIGMIAGPDGHSTSQRRFAAYRAALANAGLPFDPELVVGQKLRPEELNGAIGEWLEEQSPTAIFAASDVRAARTYEVCKSMGLEGRIPIVGFGNLEISRTLALSTVDPDPERMGRRAAECALERVAHTQVAPRTVITEVRLILRDHSAAPDYDAV
jgi:LacI family transcriptional regulator